MLAARPDALIGRAAELGRLDAALSTAAGGTTLTVLLEGEAGIGKTRLLGALAARARDRGFVVHRGEAHALERTRPFGALVDALGARAAGRPAEEILELVERRAARGPLLLALDDLHWADESTLMTVRWIVRRLEGLPLLLALAFRPSPRAPALAQVLEDARRAGATALRLPPLELRQVEELVRAELGRRPGPALAAAVRRAGGNPLWVVELVRALAAEGLLAEAPDAVELAGPGLPDSLRELVVGRVAQLPAETVGLLRAASILGDAFAPADLAAITSRRALDVAEGLDEALRAGLLGDGPDGLVFRHALVRDAIYRDIPASVRRALHREARRTLAAVGAPLAQVASHAFLGAAPGDLEAVGALRRAAAEAGSPASAVAVELLRRAESLLPDGHPERDPVLADLVGALLLAGQVAEAAALAEAVLCRAHAPEVDRVLRLALMEALSLQNRPRDLIDHGAAALGAPELGPADRALVTAQISYGRTFAGDLAGGERAGRRALALADAAGDPAMRAWCLTTLSVAVKTQGRYGEALALAERAVRLAGDPAARLRHPHFFLGLARCDADLMEGAAAAYRTAIRECDELGSSWILPDARQMAAELRFLLGDWDDAVPELEAGLEAAADRGAMVLVTQSRGYLAIVAAARGDRRAAEAALAAAGGGPGAASRYGDQVAGLAAAMLAEADDRPGEALALLRAIWARDAARADRYHHRALGPALVRLALGAGEEPLAREVAAGVGAGAALAPGVPSVRAAAMRCRAMTDRDAGAAMAAVALGRRSGRALDAAGACEDAARVMAALGHGADARRLLDEALDRHEALNASWLSARAGAALRAAGGRRGRRGPRRRAETGWESLTASERAVAELVAEGLTNREVGRRLFVSPHTVNSHLRSAFRKLGVSSRAALAAAAAREDRAIG